MWKTPYSCAVALVRPPVPKELQWESRSPPQTKLVADRVRKLTVREAKLHPAGDPSCDQAALKGRVQIPKSNERGNNMFLADSALAVDSGEVTPH